MAYLMLVFAILFEVFGSTMLKVSDGFRRKSPLIGVVVGFGLAFYLLSVALIDLPLGFSYAIWSGFGTIITVLIGIRFFKEQINKQGVLGIVFILAGMVFLNIF